MVVAQCAVAFHEPEVVVAVTQAVPPAGEHVVQVLVALVPLVVRASAAVVHRQRDVS